MGNHVKARPRAKPKPKSVKAKINRKMGSKRRTQRMGKELKKGEKGAAASFLTRAQVSKASFSDWNHTAQIIMRHARLLDQLAVCCHPWHLVCWCLFGWLVPSRVMGQR